MMAIPQGMAVLSDLTTVQQQYQHVQQQQHQQWSMVFMTYTMLAALVSCSAAPT
jgi:hypothetical protein